MRIKSKQKQNKYRNNKVCIDGIVFDSIKESQAYIVLRQKQADGIISNLVLQPKWELQPKLTETYIKHLKTKDKVCERTILQPIVYTADFSFKFNDKLVVIDVKGSKFTISKDFPLRIKMLKYHYGLDVDVIYNIKDLDKYELDG